MRLKKLRFPNCPNGGCVPYLMANITNSEKPIKGLEITDQTSFDERDASKMFQKAMDSTAYFKPILAYDRVLHPSKGPIARTWITWESFYSSATITLASMSEDKDKCVVILFEVLTKNKNLHAIGVFYNPETMEAIIIDPAKDRPIKRAMNAVFQLYTVLKVSPLFFTARGVVFYPLSELGFLFEEDAANVTT